MEVGQQATELDIFKIVFSDELLQFFISKTKEYCQNVCNSSRLHIRHTIKIYFRIVSKYEMRAILGFCLLRGQIKASQ